jgi:hypothetical protein
MTSESTLEDIIVESMYFLERFPNCVQVRIPRFDNEFERINKLL